uniref:DUF429 domain-containing protein n=1 Tax=Acetivibrio cellulolyticus TaxID=35830 RepID=UPI0001E2E6CC|nr:DUF429 domain-containing protein [Acetivibrio cellulolyticus]
MLSEGKRSLLHALLKIKQEKKLAGEGFDNMVFLDSADNEHILSQNNVNYFIGVDVHLERFTVACMDKNLDLIFIKDSTLDELIEKLNGISVEIIAVDAPYGLNKGLMNDENYRNRLGVNSGIHYNKKVSEYELTRRGIFLYFTPSKVEEISGWKSWMGTGFKLYEELKALGYQAISSGNSKSKGFVEVFPHASFTVLAERLLETKSTDAGVEERIKVLENLGFKNLRQAVLGNKHETADKLDAIVAAYTALTVWKEDANFIGDPDEGQIAIPIKEIKEKYYKTSGSKVNSDEIEILEDTEIDLKSLIYSYKNVDAVLWLKYFTPLNNAPEIFKIIDFNKHPNLEVTAKIISDEGNMVEVKFMAMKNRVDGMKVTIEDKSILKDFWGSHGDKKDYKIIITGLCNM